MSLRRSWWLQYANRREPRPRAIRTRLLSVNPAAAESLGYAPGEGIGRSLRDFLVPEKRHLFDEYLQRIQQNGRDAGLMSVISRSGDVRVWMYSNILSRSREGTAYVLGHAIDVTDRIAVETALKEREEALRAPALRCSIPDAAVLSVGDEAARSFSHHGSKRKAAS
jgi:PAS domain S-box-containing protein